MDENLEEAAQKPVTSALPQKITGAEQAEQKGNNRDSPRENACEDRDPYS
jgi:hypothetical protein